MKVKTSILGARRHLEICAVVFFVTCFATTLMYGLETQQVAIEHRGPGGISWDIQVPFASVILVVAGPNGEVFRGEFESSPSFSFLGSEGEPLPDGNYNYELRLVPYIDTGVRDELQALRESGDDTELRQMMERYGIPTEGVSYSGSFSIRGGNLVTGGGSEAGPTSGTGQTPFGAAAADAVPIAPADQVIPDDLIVDGSACIGLDCVNGESFGFDTIRLKENNLRIKFQDTSNSASFPTNDWQITANDSTNGGANKFSIDDIDGARTPFTIEAGAPSHSLYVDDGGRVGFGTSTPVATQHSRNGNTPTLRLEQDGSSGFAAQTWDLAGNEANFFIRDATNGSSLPFRIQPGAPSSSLTIGAGGNVGIGTWSAETPLHLYKGTTGDLSFKVDNQGSGNTKKANFNFAVNQFGAFTVNNTATSGQEFSVRERLDAAGPTMSVQGSVEGTQFINSSSRQFKTDFVALDTRAFLDDLVRIPLTSWRYKHEPSSVRHVGPVAEDFKESFDLGDGKHISTVDAAGVTMAAIQGLYQMMQEKDAEIDELKERIRRLEASMTNKDSH